MTRRRSVLIGIGFIALIGAGLAACATPSGSGPVSTPAPDSSGTGESMADESEIEAVWLDDGRMIGVVTQGSSTCVPVPGEASVDAGVISIELLAAPDDTACTRDLATVATALIAPEGVDPASDYEVVVTGAVTGDTELDGVPGLAGPGSEADFLPSAAWSDDSSLVILSWGSSTCVPQLESAMATSAEDVTVKFATLPEDTVCTMDMRDRVVVAWVDGADTLDDDAPTFAILEGAEFDNIRVPIIGSD